MEKLLSQRLSRRELLKAVAGLGATCILGNQAASPAAAQEMIAEDIPAEAVEQFEEVQRVQPSSRGIRPVASLESLGVSEYLAVLEPVQAKLRPTIASQDYLSYFRKVSEKDRLEDFEMYFPIYYAAQMEYGVPWQLLAIIHNDETTVSRDPRPGRSGYIGAMQRAPFHNLASINEVSDKWKTLKELPQRYNSETPPYSIDYKEILWAANFIKSKAQALYKSDDISGYLDVVRHNYSDPTHGYHRANRYLGTSEILKV